MQRAHDAFRLLARRSNLDENPAVVLFEKKDRKRSNQESITILLFQRRLGDSPLSHAMPAQGKRIRATQRTLAGPDLAARTGGAGGENTGSGGGGCAQHDGWGGAGGSGIVIVRYAVPV